MADALAWIGRQGRLCLIAGLVAGLLLPALAEALRPWIGTLIAALLVVTGIRVGARAAFGSLDQLGPTLARIGLLQLAAPLLALAVLSGLGLMHWPLALAVALMLSAPSVTGAPNFAIMIGQDPAPGMRLLVLGTMLFPLTALPVLIVSDVADQGVAGALWLSAGLLAAILASVGLGFAIRRLAPSLGEVGPQNALDGIAAILLAVVVVGLMSAIGPLLRSDPLILLIWLLAALVINLGLLLVTLTLARKTAAQSPVSTAIYAANRNIALFLMVLPPETAAPLMIFIGCYQIPMYLTPLVLARLGYDQRIPHVR